MKRLVQIVLVVLLAATWVYAQTVTDDLVGLGMPAEQAEYIATRIPGGVNLDNNAFFKSENQAGSGTISLLKADATDDTVLNADTGDVIKFSVANTPIAAIGSLDATGFDKMAVDGDTAIGGALSVTGAVGVTGALGVTGAVTFQDNLTFAANKGVVMGAATVITPVATATAPAGGISTLLSIMNPTPVATAQYITLPATPIAGATYKLANRSDYPVVMIPGGASTLSNGATFSCATGKLCQCQAMTASLLACQ